MHFIDPCDILLSCDIACAFWSHTYLTPRKAICIRPRREVINDLVTSSLAIAFLLFGVMTRQEAQYGLKRKPFVWLDSG